MAASASVELDNVDVSAIGQQYTVDAKLGEGSYGVVFRARHRQTGAYYAIKKLRLDGLAEGIPATAIREITLLQELKTHPHIVSLLSVVCRKHRLYLVFELMQEDLRSYINRCLRTSRGVKQSGERNSIVPMSEIKSFTKQMLDALCSCHESRVIHRDLKPGNVLVGESRSGALQVKLADFGLARTFELPLCTYTQEVVTLWYRAPEILLGETHYTPAVDVWSVGCIVLEMITGRAIFRGESQMHQLECIFHLVGTPTEGTWPGVTSLKGFQKAVGGTDQGGVHPPVRDWATRAAGGDTQAGAFVQSLLVCNPKERATAVEAMNHPFLSATAPQ